jgi:hypothetical protein
MIYKAVSALLKTLEPNIRLQHLPLALHMICAIGRKRNDEEIRELSRTL